MTNDKHDQCAGLAAGENDTTAAAPQRQAFTPGPWSVSTEFGAFGDVVDADGGYLAMAQQRAEDHGVENQPTRQANAHLIAAAPELLISCKEAREASAHMMRFIAANVPTDVMLRFAESMENAGFAGFGVRVQDAIAKAEGK